MKITFLNGNRDKDSFDEYISKMQTALDLDGHEVSNIELRSISLHKCKGCFGCWVKTPGKCVANDGSCHISREVMQSDTTVFASPVVMGFVSSLLKNANDKMIQNIHPYMEIVQGEIHHRARYRRYPALGLLLHPAKDTDEEDIDIIRGIYERLAINFKTTLKFVVTTSKSVEEASHEIGHH